jgi:hypothetical protein
MNSQVVSIHGATPHGEPVAEIVETIESLLARARAGDIQAFAFALAHTEGNGFANGWDGNAGTRDQLGSAIAHLSHRYFSGAYGDD